MSTDDDRIEHINLEIAAMEPSGRGQKARRKSRVVLRYDRRNGCDEEKCIHNIKDFIHMDSNAKAPWTASKTTFKAARNDVDYTEDGQSGSFMTEMEHSRQIIWKLSQHNTG